MDKKLRIQELLTLKEAALLLKVHPNTLRLWDKNGILAAVRVGQRGLWRYRKQDLVNIIDSTSFQSQTSSLDTNIFDLIKDFLIANANAIQKRATKHHEEFLATGSFRKDVLSKYQDNHIQVVKSFANNLERRDIKRGTRIFKELGEKMAIDSVKDKLTIEEALDGVIFLKQAVWDVLKEKDLLTALSVEDFYYMSQTIGTYCDVTASSIVIKYHSEYIQMLIDERKFAQDIVETIREPLIVLNKDLRVVSANESFYSSFGVSKIDTEGMLIYELGNGQWEIPELRTLLNDILPQKKIFNNYEVQHIFPNIGQKTMLLNARRIDHMQLILLAIEDISERKQIRDELHHRVQQLEAIAKLGQKALNGVSLPELMHEATALIVQTLPCDYSNILEYLPEKDTLLFRAGVGWNNGVIGKAKFSSTKDYLGGYALHYKHPVIFTDRHTEKRFEFPIYIYDHEILSGCDVVISGVNEDVAYGVLGACNKSHKKLGKNEVDFMQSIANILSEAIQRKELEQRKDDFIALASHELKTPVTSLKMYSQYITKRYKRNGDSESAQYIENMDKQLDKLTVLISNLLLVSRFKEKKLVNKSEPFSIDDLIHEIVGNIAVSVTSHTILIEGQVKQIVEADRNRIGQVLVNLITNAIKYSPDKDKVIIFCTKQEDNITVSVKDFGVGIPKNLQLKIFERFYQARDKAGKTFPGLGMGLYISNEIIKHNQGKIWVKSTLRKGSVFSFSIPVHRNTNELFI